MPERGLCGQLPTVAVVQTADSAASMDGRERAGTLLNGSARGSVLVDSEMSPVLVVVGPVLGEQASEMFLVENDNVVQELSPCRTHQAFGDPILPRTAIAGPLGTQCHGGHGADHLGGEDGIAIEEQVLQAPWREVKGEGLPELLDNPWSRWEFGDAPVKNLAPRVPDGEPD